MAVNFQSETNVIDQVFYNWPAKPLSKNDQIDLIRTGYLKIGNDTLAVSQDKLPDQRLDRIFTHLTAELSALGKSNPQSNSERKLVLDDWKDAESLITKVDSIYRHYCQRRPWYLSFLAFFFSSFSRVDDTYEAFKIKAEEITPKMLQIRLDFSRIELDKALGAEAAAIEKIEKARHIHLISTLKKLSQPAQTSVYTMIAPKDSIKKQASEPLKPDTTPLSVVGLPERKMKDEKIPPKVLNLKDDYTGSFQLELSCINDKEFGDIWSDAILNFFRTKSSPVEALVISCDTSRQMTQKEADFMVALHQIELLLPDRELNEDQFFAHSKIQVESTSKLTRDDWSQDFVLSVIISVYEGKKMDELEDCKTKLETADPTKEEIIQEAVSKVE